MTHIIAAACSDPGYYATCLPNVTADGTHLKLILQIVIGILGALTVLMVVIGGLRYTTSGGNPESLKTARNTILYSLIGLVIVISAEALVGFFLGKA